MTRQTSDTLQALRARRRELAAAITAVGFTATGTVLEVRTVCGSPGCACHADPDKRHGPYWQHTRKISNKTVTRRLARYATCSPRCSSSATRPANCSSPARQEAEAQRLIREITGARSAERESGCLAGFD